MKARRTPNGAALLTMVLALEAAACRRTPPPGGSTLRPGAGAGSLSTRADTDGISRRGILVVKGRSFEWEIPEGAAGRLRLVWTAPESRGPVALVVEGREPSGNSRPRVLGRATRDFGASPSPRFWNEDFEVGRHAGRLLRLRSEPASDLFLSDVRLARPHPSNPAIVLLVFDTTRADAVGFGGCPDPSSPRLDAIFRDAWKSRRAYAPASWTIPSMASLLTGRVPAAHEDGDGSPLGIAPGIPTIAEDFGGAGWATAAFVANPTLRIENGFSDGFTTFFTTPYEGASITLPASETLRRVPPWLEAHRGEPLFLWVHLMDPHDPYAAPDRTPGRTPFDPGYAGVFRGDEVNRLQLGDPPPASPADARHLEALYHDEVRYADSEIGRLWDGEPDRERSRWTVVFTSDHGEEFGEHGGWKHGPALYDEVLRVPLAIRPGAARRGPAIAPEVPVSLLDVAPTLEALAGLPPARRPLDGLDLLDPSSGKRSALPPVTMLTGGAPRAAVVRAGEKLFFFDRLGTRGIPDASKDPAGHRLAIRLPRLQPGLARFDLAADPGENQRLPIDRSTFAADWQSIERAIAHTRWGLEIRVAGTGAVRLRVVGLSADAAVEPFALEENDRFERTRASSGAALEARLDLTDGLDGFLIREAPAAPFRVENLSTEAGACLELRLAGARPLPLPPGQPQAVPPASIPRDVPAFETTSGCSSVFLWTASGGDGKRLPAEVEEARKKLRALGYLH